MDAAYWLPLFSIPLISAVIGWFTNMIAIYMLFHPRSEKNVLGMKLQGLVPRRQADMADTIADTVSTHLVNREAIERELSQPAVREALIDGLSQYAVRCIDDFTEGLPAPVRKLVPGALKRSVERRIRRETTKRLPVFMEQVTPAIASNVDFRSRIRGEIAAYPHERLEALIHEIAGKELRAIEIWGAVLGFVIGLLQLALIACFR